MKNLFFLLLTTLFINSVSYGQTSDRQRYKIMCYTTSCCSLGIFTIEIASTTHCHYISVGEARTSGNQYSIKFNSPTNLETVEIAEDVIMPQFTDKNGDAVVLAKGKYSLKDNVLVYSPLDNAKLYKVCHEEHVKGHILGHEVDYTISMCVYYIWFKKAGNGSIKITPQLTEEQNNEIIKNNNQITFKEDQIIKSSDFTYNLKAGDYQLNEDGSIYIINSRID